MEQGKRSGAGGRPAIVLGGSEVLRNRQVKCPEARHPPLAGSLQKRNSEAASLLISPDAREVGVRHARSGETGGAGEKKKGPRLLFGALGP